MEAIEERVETLETTLQRFIATTNAAILRQDRICERLDRNYVESQQTNARLDQEYRSLQPTCERLDKTCERLDRNYVELQQTNARLDQTCRRLDLRIEASERSFEELKKESRKHTLEMASIAKRFGRFAEDIVAPNIPRIAQEAFGITHIEFEVPRIKRPHVQDRSRVREFDIVVAGDRQLLVTSVKSTARDGDITKFVAALKEIFDYFPEFRGYTLVPIFASMTLGTDLVRRLTRLKIYAMALGQRTMELLNLDEVRARRANGK